jgi:hypothetical protein
MRLMAKGYEQKARFEFDKTFAFVIKWNIVKLMHYKKKYHFQLIFAIETKVKKFKKNCSKNVISIEKGCK